MQTLPSVALVGRPNVGKSRMFNRLIGRRVAIVHDQAGVTRDLATADVDHHFTLMDTGGIGFLPEMTTQEIFDATEEQVFFAIQAATLVLFVTAGPEGCTPVDEAIAQKLRKYNKKTLLVANKMERGETDADRLNEFYKLGFGEAIAVSAEHGLNFNELYERVVKEIGPKRPFDPEAEKKRKKARIRICLAGRPNVGKSSLGNSLLKSDRLIVSDVAGTTRDSIETDLDYEAADGEKWQFRLVDTAGLKPKRKLNSSVDYFSSLRSEEAIKRSEVVFLVLDAQVGVTKHDKKLAGEVLVSGASLVIVVNKWDCIMDAFKKEGIGNFEDITDFKKSFIEGIREQLFFLPESPIIFTSAKTGFEVGAILSAARDVCLTQREQLPTSKINKLVQDLLERQQPKLVGGKRFKVYYAVQVGNRPFKFRMFCNHEERLDDRYKRYLENGFHKAFNLAGCPIKFEVVGKPESGGLFVQPDAKELKDKRVVNTLSKHGKAREGDYRHRRKKKKKK